MPEIIEPDVAFYHWSPRARRKQITRRGMQPGSWSVGRDWKPPFVCFSHDPKLAWTLSGRIHPEILEWDLWLVYESDLEGYEKLTDTYVDTGRAYVKEVRVYHGIPKRNLWLVGERNA